MCLVSSIAALLLTQLVCMLVNSSSRDVRNARACSSFTFSGGTSAGNCSSHYKYETDALVTGWHVRGHPKVNVLLAQSVSVIYFSSHTCMCTKKIEICSVLQEGLVSNMSASRRKQSGWQDTEWCGLTSSQEEVASSDHQLPTSDQLGHFYTPVFRRWRAIPR